MPEEEVITQEKNASKKGGKKEKKDPLVELQLELDTEKDRYLRLFAEYEKLQASYRKRAN